MKSIKILSILLIICFMAIPVSAFTNNTIGQAPPDDTAYNATTWNGDLRSATKNTLRDKIETLATAGDNIIIPDGGTIGSASDTDAISISSGGDITLTQDIVMASGKLIGITGDLDLVTLTSGLVDVAGKISAGVEENSMTATDTWSAQEIRGTVISNYGQSASATYTLPAAAEGYNFVFICAVVQDVHIDPNGSDKIYLDGVALDDGDKVSNTATAIGHNITFVAFETADGVYDWSASSGPGPWVDGG